MRDVTGAEASEDVYEQVKRTISERGLAGSETPVLLMVSGGSDSTALAYLASQLHDEGLLGPVAMLHVNHRLRGADADADERFVEQLANLLGLPLFACSVDVAGEAKRTGANVEAVGRRHRYLAANEALESLCRHEGMPVSDGRILTAHTADDRIENFYMRSIVGTGPGGFRAMLYENGPVVRPLLDIARDDLRLFIQERERAGLPVACDAQGALWCEDATNAHTDKFRAFVRHEIVPKARERNPRLTQTLCRTMNLIADEDDMLARMTHDVVASHARWNGRADDGSINYAAGCVLLPSFGAEPRPLQRRAVLAVLQGMLPPDTRIDTASVEAVLAAWVENEAAEEDARPRMVPVGGYVANIQGDLAVSANKHGVRIEPMAAFRARRKRN